MLFCLPWHPGNVLDVMELSDLKRVWQEDIALNEHSYQQQLQQHGLIAALHSFAEIAIAVRGLALKG